jgi:hypothetical protein
MRVTYCFTSLHLHALSTLCGQTPLADTTLWYDESGYPPRGALIESPLMPFVTESAYISYGGDASTYKRICDGMLEILFDDLRPLQNTLKGLPMLFKVRQKGIKCVEIEQFVY